MVATTEHTIWEDCLKIIRDNMNAQSFKTWFTPIEPVKLTGDVLTIQVPSMFFYEWLEEHYVDLLSKTIKRYLGPEARLEYNIVVDKNSNGSGPRTVNVPTSANGTATNPAVSMSASIGSEIPNPFVIPGLKKIKIDPQLNNSYSFDTFVEGESNSLARSAGYAVSNKPGETAFNPLMISTVCAEVGGWT